MASNQVAEPRPGEGHGCTTVSPSPVVTLWIKPEAAALRRASVVRLGLHHSAHRTEGCDYLQVDSDSDFDALSSHWWAYQRLSRGSREERKALEQGQPAEAQAARDFVAAAIESGAADAIRLLAVLNDDAPPGDDGVTVGSGPLEELITAHGRELAEEIDKSARRSPGFARALSRVWLTPGHLDPSAEAKLSAWVPSLTRA